APDDDDALLTAWSLAFDSYVGLLRFDPIHRARTKKWPTFFLARPVKFDALVPTIRPDPALPEARFGLPAHARPRDGFDLTDRRKSARDVTGETFYCLICHEREKDSCSKGFRLPGGGRDARSSPKDGAFKPNPLGVELKGCPLEEKIS